MTVWSALVAVPGGEVPSALAALGELSRARAIAIAPDGGRVAAAFPAGKEDEQSRVDVAGLAEGWVLDGKVLVLRWSPSGRSLLALVEKIGRKGRPSAFLDAMDASEPGRRPQRIVLPESARGLDVRPSDSLLVIASDGDLRTLDAETLRSGRMYALTGENRSIALVPGGERVLVGRTDGVVRVDLSALRDAALARAGVPDQRQGLARRDLQAEVGQDGLRTGVREAQPAECHAAFHALDRFGYLLYDPRLAVDQVASL